MGSQLKENIKWYRQMPKEEKWLYKYSNLWMTPLKYTVVSLLLFTLTVWLDLWQNFGSRMPFVQPDYQLTMTILSSLTTGLLSLTSFTFYGVLTALTTFSSMFSPRILRNFMVTKKTQRTLGIFIGSFLYVILCLLFLTEETSYFFIPVTATFLAVFSLGAFVVFVNHIINWLQITNMTIDMKNESIRIIGQSAVSELDVNQLEAGATVEEQLPKEKGMPILLKESGYLQSINFKELFEQAQQDDIIVRLEHKVDNFIFAYSPVLTYWKTKDSTEELDTEKYINMFHIGKKQRELHDIEYSLNKFVEIAIRALGNDDPRTASGTLYQLGDLLINISQNECFTSYLVDDEQNLRVIVKSLDFDDYLHISFASIRQYAGQNTVVTIELMAVMAAVARGVKERDHDSVWSFVEYIVKGFNYQYLHRLDRRRFYEILQDIANTTGYTSEYSKLADKSIAHLTDEDEITDAKRYIGKLD
ncbi:DUF2254 domain-containing protein [Jeotgalibacillus sp. ET6]|uniref:DUF2254 domain-containing protein n=1 Tax=Jeotgalibacillus sp. ET6 TaxID=3037260 RepID=UPI00241851EE|nr:DUF2254 domain-containing protein [Jeotgalibacillus sp. ET6]MDG5472014.1 DUF2254 domain-containing protein [Jeotgalibacillus sp. ET6]